MYKLIKLKDESARLCEIFQTHVVRICFVNTAKKGDALIQLHQPGKCRDFLGDIPWSRATNKKVQIYGMAYDYNKSPYDLERTRLSLTFPDEDMMTVFKNNFSFLTNKEKSHGIPESQWFETDHADTLIVEGDKHWQQVTWKISLYSFYLKLMTYTDPRYPDEPESEYMPYINKTGVEKMLLDNIMIDMDYFNDNLHYNHNASGFVSLIKCIADLKAGATYNSDWGGPQHLLLKPMVDVITARAAA